MRLSLRGESDRRGIPLECGCGEIGAGSEDEAVDAKCFRVLGIRVDAVQIPDVVAQMERWIQTRDTCRFIAVTGMHGVTEAARDPSFRHILSGASMVVPDGMPLVWASRMGGPSLKRRVYGPELMLTFCGSTARKGYRHFLYGGRPGVPQLLAGKLRDLFVGLEVVGTYAPPFRPLTPEEDEAVVATINRAAPDILWVGLGTPKQERWMWEHQERLNVPVMLGVGAAFDIHSGMLRQAPIWMREQGLEWLFRLAQEPRRLWRRYLLCGTQFVFYVLLELSGVKKFGS